MKKSFMTRNRRFYRAAATYKSKLVATCKNWLGYIGDSARRGRHQYALKDKEICLSIKGLGYIAVFFLSSCANNLDYSNLGKVSFANNINKSSFTFLVSDEYIRSNEKSPFDKNHPKMTVAETKLLVKILKDTGSCLDKNGYPSFVITSKQEKIYDTTFLHLIEKNYNARPIVPAMYFGRCITPAT